MYFDLALGQCCLLILESDDPIKPVEFFNVFLKSQILTEEGKFGKVLAQYLESLSFLLC